MLKKKIKKIALTGLTIALVAGSAIGVSAATQHMRSKGVWNYKNQVVIDGDAVGFWLTANEGNNIIQITEDIGNDTKYAIVQDDDIKANSIITVFYSNDTKDTVGKSGLKYIQEDGKISVKFSSRPLKAGSTDKYEDIVIDAIHIVNPVNAPANP